MTRAEIVAFNAGIAAVAALAAQAATAMRSREKRSPTRLPFATEALQAIADEAVGLGLPLPSCGGESTAAASPGFSDPLGA